MKPSKYEFTLSGFAIGLILIAMFGTVFALTMGQMSANYNVTNPESFEKYENYTFKLEDLSKNITEETNINQDSNILDIIGGYFRSGYSAMKGAIVSFDLFQTMMGDVTNDVPQLDIFKKYLILMVMMALFIGVIIAVLVKMRI